MFDKKTTGLLNLPQREFNRQVLRILTELQASDVSSLEEAIADLETAIGDESTSGTILARIKALEDAE